MTRFVKKTDQAYLEKSSHPAKHENDDGNCGSENGRQAHAGQTLGFCEYGPVHEVGALPNLEMSLAQRGD